MAIKKALFFVLAVLLCLNAVSAVEFIAVAAPMNNNIGINEMASFNFTITNNLNTYEEFRVYTLDYPEWSIETEPIMNPIIIAVPAMLTKSFKLLVDPIYANNIGLYAVNVNVKSTRTGQIMKVPVEVAIKSTGIMIGGYIPTVVINLRMPLKIDPREEIPMQIELSNQNLLDIGEATIRIESKDIYKEIKANIGPKETKVVELNENISPLAKPKNDAVAISVLKDNRIISGPVVQAIEIIEYADARETSAKKGILRTEKAFTFKTNNNEYKGQVMIATSFFKSLVTSTKPKSRTASENGKTYLGITPKLDANNEMEIRVVENYRPLLFIALFIIIAVLVYFVYRSPLVVRKHASSMEKREGGISELKVVLNVKNRSEEPLRDIEITDTIPNITSIEKELFIGTLQPYQVMRHEKKGTILKWKVDDLSAGEERVVSYKMKSRLPILGSLSLEGAVAKYNHKKKDKITRSNTLTVSA